MEVTRYRTGDGGKATVQYWALVRQFVVTSNTSSNVPATLLLCSKLSGQLASEL